MSPPLCYPYEMKPRFLLIPAATMLLAACAPFDGTYSPACTAYEGDSISLSDGRFVWSTFTDAVPVDDAGNPLDATPGYPLRGSYSYQDGILILRSDSGVSPDALYVRRHDGRRYLLTRAEVEQLDSAGEMPECALVLGGAE